MALTDKPKKIIKKHPKKDLFDIKTEIAIAIYELGYAPKHRDSNRTSDDDLIPA